MASEIPNMISLVGSQPLYMAMMVHRDVEDAQAKLAILVRAFMMLAMPAINDKGREMEGGANAAVHQ